MPSFTALSLGALVLANWKNLPFVFHLRFYYFVLKNMYIYRARKPPSIFVPMAIKTYTPLMEMDFNLHKSNSTYFSDMDISRANLLTEVMKDFWRSFRDSSGPVLKRHEFVYSPLGSVGLVFRHEIKPYVTYEVESRVLGWTAKWLFVYTVFRGSGGQIHAYGVSKYVLKQKRLTIAPERAIEFQGLLTPEAKAQNAKMQQFFKETLDIERIVDVIEKHEDF